MIVIAITEAQRAALMHPISGQSNGGFQRLFTALRGGIRSDTEGLRLEMTRADADRVPRYAWNYGEGGFQNLLRSIEADVKKALGDSPETGTLFDE